VVLIQIPISGLSVVREMQDSLDFVIYLRLGPAAQHAYHRVVEQINECFEALFCGVMLQQRGPCYDWMRPSICVHFLHGKTKLIYLIENKHVGQYRRISEHAFYAKIHELFVNIVGQEGAEIKLCGGLFIGGENG
jgi:hypothetical protein